MEAINNKDTHDVPVQPAQKTIAIVQLTRFGDLIQTIQMAKSFRGLETNIRLILIARKTFSAPLRFIIDQYFDECITIDLNDLTKSDTVVNLQNTLKNINGVLDIINSYSINACINLTFSKSSNYLCSLIKANHKLGSYFDCRANVVIQDKWSQYLYSNVLGTTLNPFNLVDLFKLITGVKSAPPLKEESSHQENINEIIIHPFASNSKKHWKESKWSEIIYNTLKTHPDINIKLVGAKDELSKSLAILETPLIAEYSSRVTNLVGKLNIEELYQTFSANSLFLGHDSMVSHLAALKGSQALTISLGTVRPHETMPYGENNYSLIPKSGCFPCAISEKCDFFKCHADIPYKLVNACISSLLESREITYSTLVTKISHFHLDSADILRTRFNSLGHLSCNSINVKDVTINSSFSNFYQLSWVYLLSELELNSDFMTVTKKLEKNFIFYKDGLSQMFELSEFGKKYSRYIIEEISSNTPNIQKIKDFSYKLDEIDSLLSIVKTTYPLLSPVVNYNLTGRGNLKGDNLVQLTESSFYVFNETANISSMLYELIDSTINADKRNKKHKSIPTERRG